MFEGQSCLTGENADQSSSCSTQHGPVEDKAHLSQDKGLTLTSQTYFKSLGFQKFPEETKAGGML